MTKPFVFILPPEFSGDPQSTAMLQAFYSRSIESIKSRLEKLGGDVTKVRKALKTYYVGYGHQSIADCGSATVFVEGVSILAAKAIQEDPLYNGQECSTRYIRLSGEMYDANEHAGQWMNLHRDILAALIPCVRQAHPFEGSSGDTAGEKIWENATLARAFDIARAWIPTSALTNLSIHMSLRKINDLTARLLGHPLKEVRDLATLIRDQCVLAYPDACQPFTLEEARYAAWLKEDTSLWYMNPHGTLAPAIQGTRFNTDGSLADLPVGLFVEMKVSPRDALLINRRPRHAPLPAHFQTKATFTLNGFMDYACWRDIQRHRRQVGAPPMLYAKYGMSEWYMQQLRDYLHEDDADKFVLATTELFADIENTGSTEEEFYIQRQYHLPIGVSVPFEYKFGLSQAFYLAELRSGNTVHPALRPYAQAVAQELTNCGLRVDYDNQPARFDVRRGKQTIQQKEQA